MKIYLSLKISPHGTSDKRIWVSWQKAPKLHPCYCCFWECSSPGWVPSRQSFHPMSVSMCMPLVCEGMLHSVLRHQWIHHFNNFRKKLDDFITCLVPGRINYPLLSGKNLKFHHYLSSKWSPKHSGVVVHVCILSFVWKFIVVLFLLLFWF